MDEYRAYQILFILKDFLTKCNAKTFKSFDLIDNIYDRHGDSFRFPVNSAEEVLYYLKFYGLADELSEKDIELLRKNKGLSKTYLILHI